MLTCNFPGMIRLFFCVCSGLLTGISHAIPALLFSLPPCVNPDLPFCLSPSIRAAIPAWRVALLSGVKFLPRVIESYNIQQN